MYSGFMFEVKTDGNLDHFRSQIESCMCIQLCLCLFEFVYSLGYRRFSMPPSVRDLVFRLPQIINLFFDTTLFRPFSDSFWT